MMWLRCGQYSGWVWSIGLVHSPMFLRLIWISLLISISRSRRISALVAGGVARASPHRLCRALSTTIQMHHPDAPGAIWRVLAHMVASPPMDTMRRMVTLIGLDGQLSRYLAHGRHVHIINHYVT